MWAGDAVMRLQSLSGIFCLAGATLGWIYKMAGFSNIGAEIQYNPKIRTLNFFI